MTKEERECLLRINTLVGEMLELRQRIAFCMLQQRLLKYNNAEEISALELSVRLKRGTYNVIMETLLSKRAITQTTINENNKNICME